MADEPRRTSVVTNGIRLEVARAGPEGGPPTILLHGFPEDWSCWRRQIGPLAGAGLDVLAPDQRGYGRSDKPPGVAAYSLDTLADDVLGLIESTGRPSASLVGHDWGGVVAWWVAIRHPERVDRLAIVNAPHPVAFRRYTRTHPAQLLRSWYVFAFQIPRLPEAMFRRRDWRALVRALRETSRPGTFTGADFDHYRRVWSEPGAITSMVDWYRAALRHPPGPTAEPRVRVPTLMIWGTDDHFIERGVAEASLALCDSARLEWIEGATHWVQHEEPDRVNLLLFDFLS